MSELQTYDEPAAAGVTRRTMPSEAKGDGLAASR